MREVSYSIFEVPDLQGEKKEKTFQARINSAGVVDTEYLCEHISSRSSLSAADVKAALDSLNFYLDIFLSQGYSIHMNDLGIFSLGLKSRCVKDPESGNSVSVEIGGIHFRPCVKLKEKIKGYRLSHKPREKVKQYSLEDRLKRIMSHVEEHRYIDRKACETLNKVSAYKANADLQLLVKTNQLEVVGHMNSRVYIKT